MNQPALATLTARDARRIARHAAAADATRLLHPVQQALLHRRGWLKMLAPREYGGAEMPLPQVVRLEEAVAAVDGSMGWVLTLCAGAGWFAGFLAPEMARNILQTPRVCLGGSGAATGFADQDGDGYRISGRWDYASGAPMTTHFTLNAIVRVDGQPLRDPQGAPLIRAFLVPAAQVIIEPTWTSLGMRASATHSYRIEAAWVSAAHGFSIAAATATAAGPLYRYPFYSLAYVTLAANVAGMAHHFMQLARQSMAQRRHARQGLPLLEVAAVAALLTQHEREFAAARSGFYQVLDASWAKVDAGAALTPDDMLAVQHSALALTGLARTAVTQLYPYCGLHAAQEGSAINLVWRDFHTASQHALLLP